MGSAVENKNAAVVFPSMTTKALRTNEKQGVFRYASSATAASVAVPLGWKGNFLTFRFSGPGLSCNVGMSFRVAAETIVKDQLASVGTGSVKAGARLDDSQFIDGIVPPDATFLEWVSSNTGGFVEFWISEIGAIVPVQ